MSILQSHWLVGGTELPLQEELVGLVRLPGVLSAFSGVGCRLNTAIPSRSYSLDDMSAAVDVNQFAGDVIVLNQEYHRIYNVCRASGSL